MTAEQEPLLKVLNIQDEALSIMRVREQVYQGGWLKDGPARNLSRASDKIARATSIYDLELRQQDRNLTPAMKSALRDDLLDAMNYCAFTIACLESQDAV